PDLDDPVLAGRGQQLAVGAEGDEADPVGMALQHGYRPAGGDVPQADRLVQAARRQDLAVGAEGGGADDVAVAGKQAPLLERGWPPPVQVAGAILAAGAAGPGLAVGADGHRLDLGLPVLLREAAAPRAEVPELRLAKLAPLAATGDQRAAVRR